MPSSRLVGGLSPGATAAAVSDAESPAPSSSRRAARFFMDRLNKMTIETASQVQKMSLPKSPRSTRRWWHTEHLRHSGPRR